MKQGQKERTETVINAVIAAAEDKKAIDPVVLDVRRSGRVTDYMIMISGDSSPMLKAIAKEIGARMKKMGVKGTAWDGETDSGWMICDLGHVMVHVMSEKMREYYDLEGLWGKEAVVFHE